MATAEKDVGCIMIIALVFLFIGLGTGISLGVWRTRTSAIEANVGHYEIDPRTGETEFVWEGKNDNQGPTTAESRE